MSNIREVQFTKPDADPDILKMLEKWIERVNAGDVCAIGIVGVRPGGKVATEWIGAASGWLHQLISGVSILKHRILNANIEPEDA